MGGGVIRILLLSTLLVVSSAAASWNCESSDWRTSAVGGVSGDNIMADIEALEAFGTRDFHVTSSYGAALHVRDRFDELGIHVQLQEFPVGDLTAVNVIGTVNPENAGAGVILLGAHYDSENREVDDQSGAENTTAPGADDNASGVSVMIEVARVLAEAEEFERTAMFVAFGAEESGYDGIGGAVGSRYFVHSDISENLEYDGAVVLDMVGYRAGPADVATLVSNAASAGLVESALSSAERYAPDLGVTTLFNSSLVYSDHSSFWLAGIESILVIEQLDTETNIPVNPFYHTSYDTADTLSSEQMVEVARMLVGMAVGPTDSGETSYITPQIAVILICTATTVSLVVLLFRRRKDVGT